MTNSRKTFSKIYDKYIDKIYRFIFVKVNSKEIAEDLTSESFSKAWSSFKEKGSDIENIQAFLYRIARNLVTDYYRQKGRAHIIPTDNPRIIDPRHNLKEEVEIKSDIENIKIVLSNLKDDYQNVIVWRYLDDLSIPEVAKLLDRTEDATRVLLHRALKVLKDKMDQV